MEPAERGATQVSPPFRGDPYEVTSPATIRGRMMGGDRRRTTVRHNFRVRAEKLFIFCPETACRPDATEPIATARHTG